MKKEQLWTFLVLALGASGAANAQSQVVISQLYGGGGNAGAPFTNDFVELFNRSNAPVDLAGWSVQYASATGTGNFSATPINGLLQPGQYLLVQMGGGANGAPLPTADAVGSAAMSASAGKIVLARTPGSLACNGGSAPCSAAQLALIEDLVGYGGANFSETTPAPTLSNTSAAIRLESCIDTDVNAADFIAAAPTPRNSASPLAPCTGGPVNQPIVASCASLQAESGVSTLHSVQASDADGNVVSATLSPGNEPGIELIAVTPGATLHAQLQVTAAASVGAHPQVLTFTNDDALPQTISCSFTITVMPPTLSLKIHDVQGRAHLSPYANQRVSNLTGLVTAVAGNGYYVEDPAADTDPATSEGIFVFTRTAPPVRVGDSVRVAGTVAEFRPGGNAGSGNLTTTEIIDPATVILARDTVLPPPTLLGEGGRFIPTMVIDDDAVSGDVETSGSFDVATDGIDFFESLEGMRVRLNAPVATGPTSSNGEISLLADSGIRASLRTARGGILVRADDFNPERVIADDFFLPAPQVNTGDTFPDAIGVIDYSFGNFKLHVTQPLARIDNGLQAESATFTGAASKLTIGSYNVENLAPGDPPEKFATLAEQIVTRLRNPDILALMEVQDNSGATNNGVVEAGQTYAALIAAIANAGGPGYQFRSIDPANNADGGQGGGNIRVGFLFNPARVSFVDRAGGGTSVATTVTALAGQPQLSASPGRIDPANPAFANSRKPLVGEFIFNGRKLFVIANHFNSKGGDEPLFGRRQPPLRETETQRHLQAAVVRDFVGQILAVNPKAAIAVLGDLNDFEFSQTASLLEGNGALHGLIELLPANERYTYVFEGNSQTLDHILVSSSLRDYARPEMDVVHANAEFATQASDHDPDLARLDLPRAADADRDGDVDAVDVTLITLSVRSSTPNPFDPRDVDGNSTINLADVLRAVALCTRRNCALR